MVWYIVIEPWWMVLYCVVWYSMVWYGVVWCGVVWCGVVWCGVAWYGTKCTDQWAFVCTHQCAFVSLKFFVVKTWIAKSCMMSSPNLLDQWGGPNGFTGFSLDGRFHVTGFSFIPIKTKPPPSVCVSHHA